MTRQQSPDPACVTRGPYQKSAQTRHRIVRAATEIFAERGYRNGSTAEIASRAGTVSARPDGWTRCFRCERVRTDAFDDLFA